MRTLTYGDLAIVPLPVGDNYHYIVIRAGRALVVDPGWAQPVLDALSDLGVRLTHILLTHGDHDHVDGVPALRRAFAPQAIAPAGLAGVLVDRTVSDGEVLDIDGIRVEVVNSPGHRPIHVAYHLPEHGVIFSGDCLFAGGCGRLWGNPPALQFASLERLAALPDGTRVFGGHEYTVPNLRFAMTVDPGNVALMTRLADAEERAARGGDLDPSTIALERATNPFLRTSSAAIRAALGMPRASSVEVFAELRRRKDAF